MGNRVTRQLARMSRVRVSAVVVANDMVVDRAGGGGAPSKRGRPRLVAATATVPANVSPAAVQVEEKMVMKNVKSPNPIDIHVGSRIRMRRTMLGLSQGALGEQLGITFQQIQKYEKGTNRVGASRLQAIARILQVSVSYFFESAPDASAAEVSSDMKAMTDFIASGEGIALNKAFLTIGDPTVRAKVLALVKALANDTDSE